MYGLSGKRSSSLGKKLHFDGNGTSLGLQKMGVFKEFWGPNLLIQHDHTLGVCCGSAYLLDKWWPRYLVFCIGSYWGRNRNWSGYWTSQNK